jgi:hypothetical protein
MYDHVEELQRVNIMDEKQIVLKVRNFKKFGFMTSQQFHELKQAISDRLQTHGYELVSACCGRFSVAKINKE